MVALRYLLVGMLTPLLSLTLQFTGTLYKEVVSTFPAEQETSCFLASYGVSSKVACAALCNQNMGCNLFCLTGTSCRLYSAWVTGYWTGISGEVPQASCYSSWEEKNNIAANATTLGASDPYESQFAKNKGNDGYYCSRLTYCYFSEKVKDPWWSANLGSPRAISSVKLITNNLINRDIHLDEVEIRVGNSTTSFQTSNQLLGKLTETAVHGAVYTFTAQNPITGSVVSVQRMGHGLYLLFCEIQIIYV